MSMTVANATVVLCRFHALNIRKVRRLANVKKGQSVPPSTVAWWKHMRKYGKRAFWKKQRRADNRATHNAKRSPLVRKSRGIQTVKPVAIALQSRQYPGGSVIGDQSHGAGLPHVVTDPHDGVMGLVQRGNAEGAAARRKQ
jgi:hypothetical protein